MRNRFRWAVLALVVVIAMPAASAVAAEDVIHIAGEGVTSGDWSAARIGSDLAADVKPVKYTSKGQPHEANAISVIALLKAAGVPTELKMDPTADPKVKNFAIRLAVVVQGRDGYTATLSFAELLAEVGNREAWLALDSDGKPLGENEGPAKLIVPGDAKPARWVRGLATITVVDPTAATTRPTNP